MLEGADAKRIALEKELDVFKECDPTVLDAKSKTSDLGFCVAT